MLTHFIRKYIITIILSGCTSLSFPIGPQDSVTEGSPFSWFLILIKCTCLGLITKIELSRILPASTVCSFADMCMSVKAAEGACYIDTASELQQTYCSI